jgi:hypothetical protein
MPDLTKLAYHSSYPAFKNNTVYSGSFNISGTATSGVNTRTATINLTSPPDLVDIIFNGLSDSLDDPRPDSGWFKTGAVWANGNTGFDFPTPWVITYRISGSTVVITATYIQTFTDTTTLTTTAVNYRIVDYSVF